MTTKPPKKPKSVPAVIVDRPTQSLAQLMQIAAPNITERGKIIACEQNLEALLKILGVVVNYNVISKQIEIKIPGQSFSVDNSANASLAWITSRIKEVGMDCAYHREYLALLADKNQYNPVETWILSRAWDGRTRLPDLYSTIKAVNEKAKEYFIFRWLVGAVALACSPDGVDSSGILVLQGNQGLGKTWWFRKLVPKDRLPNMTRADASINPHDKDSVNQAITYWLVELGELDATFKRSEIAALKSFITREFDIFRRPFMPTDSKFPRRTAFMASVNPKQYLTDETGNRRFWTIECESINSYHDIDMQQLWAEVHEKWVNGASYQLSDEEKLIVTEINKEHITADPITEMLTTKYDWESSQIYWRWATATEILEEMGVKRISKAELRVCAATVRELNGNRDGRKNNNKVLLVPEKKGTIYGA